MAAVKRTISFGRRLNRLFMSVIMVILTDFDANIPIALCGWFQSHGNIHRSVLVCEYCILFDLIHIVWIKKHRWMNCFLCVSRMFHRQKIILNAWLFNSKSQNAMNSKRSLQRSNCEVHRMTTGWSWFCRKCEKNVLCHFRWRSIILMPTYN